MTTLTNPVGTQQHWSTYAYDPLMRLAAIDSSNPVLDAQLGYDGLEVIYEGLSNNRTRRYVHGPGVDEPLAAYLITSTGTSRSWFHADERGSVLIQTYDANAAPNLMGSYDEYGVGIGSGRFHYTGQYQLADAGLHYYRSRIYDPKLGRFLQPDPIGYEAGMNLYAYVGGDPVNFSDPLGLAPDWGDAIVNGDCVLLCANPRPWDFTDHPGFGGGGGRADPEADAGPPTGNPAECGNADCTEVIIAFKPCRIAWCVSRWWRLGGAIQRENGYTRFQYEIAGLAGRGAGRLAPVGRAGTVRRTTIKFNRPKPQLKGSTIDRSPQLRREHDFAKVIRDSRSEANRSLLQKFADALEEAIKGGGGGW